MDAAKTATRYRVAEVSVHRSLTSRLESAYCATRVSEPVGTPGFSARFPALWWTPIGLAMAIVCVSTTPPSLAIARDTLLLAATISLKRRCPARLTGIFEPSASTATQVSFVLASMPGHALHIYQIRTVQPQEAAGVERRFEA